MKKATSFSPTNIAFIKFWGKGDPELNLPNNGSLSVSLSNLHTTTTVEFSDKYKEDEIVINDTQDLVESERAIVHLDKIRKMAGINTKAKVVSRNNFPTASGLASSASGFSALSLAGASAAGLNLSEKELSVLARLGSGSASRSIPGGFAEWLKGDSNDTSYAYQLYPPEYWDIKAIAVIINMDKKEVGSTGGHKIADTSPYYQVRQSRMEEKIRNIKEVMEKKDFQRFGEIVEEEAIDLHLIALSSNPSIIYWEPGTISVMKMCRRLRKEGVLVYFTYDAGPQPVLFCQPKDLDRIISELKELTLVKESIVNDPVGGAHLIDEHLF